MLITEVPDQWTCSQDAFQEKTGNNETHKTPGFISKHKIMRFAENVLSFRFSYFIEKSMQHEKQTLEN